MRLKDFSFVKPPLYSRVKSLIKVAKTAASSSFPLKPIFTKGDSKLRSSEAFGELEGNGFANPRRQDVYGDWIQASYVLYRYIYTKWSSSFAASGIPFSRRVSSSPVHPALQKLSPHHSRLRTRKVRFAMRKRAKKSATRVATLKFNPWSTARNEQLFSQYCSRARIIEICHFPAMKFSRLQYQFILFIMYYC